MRAEILDKKLKQLVASERKITFEILLLIQTIDIVKSYRELGFSSLFDYLTRGLGYSEGAAQRRISAARMMKQSPGIAEDIKSGELNLTQVSMVHSAIRQEEKARKEIKEENLSPSEKTQILQSLKGKSTWDTQKELKEKLPHYEIPQNHKPHFKNKKIQVTLSFDESEWEKIKSLQTHFSHAVPDMKLESLLLYWNEIISKKQQKLLARDHKISNTNTKSTALTAKTKREVWQNAQAQCEYKSPTTHIKCQAKYFLEIEHKKPKAFGGGNEKENLRLFCREHNALMAREWGLSQPLG